MNIRSKLIFAFSGLTIVSIIMAIVLFWLGNKGKDYLNQALRDYSVMVQVRDIQFSLDKQWKSFNYYLVLSEEEELNNYRDFANNIYTNFDEWQKVVENNIEISTISERKKSYERLNNLGLDIMGLNKEGKRDSALNKVDTEFMPMFDKTRANFEYLSEEKTKNLVSSQSRMVQLGQLSTLLSLIVSIFAILWATFMGFYIFRSIALPLIMLQEGAKVIGSGDLSYRINMTSKDEIGQLANSFNAMVENLKNLQAQIVQMDRMSSLGQLAGGVAHELNNPLTGVLGQSQLLLEKVPQENVSMRTSLEKIERAAQRCRSIVRALLDFARQKDYNFQDYDIHPLIDERLEFCQSDLTSSKITVKKNYGPGLPKVKVSSSHIQQVFLNLITNAAQSMVTLGGGTLTISTLCIDRNDETGTTRYFLISFKDTGIGIKKDNLDHIFDPFFTTKDIGKGTGLGLTVSYGIVQRHNGEILASSAGENQGAEFRVLIPCPKKEN